MVCRGNGMDYNALDIGCKHGKNSYLLAQLSADNNGCRGVVIHPEIVYSALR